MLKDLTECLNPQGDAEAVGILPYVLLATLIITALL